MKIGFKQGLLSATVFGGIIAGLVSVDPRVRERFMMLVDGGVAPWQSRARDLGDVVLDAAQHQSIENGPLVVFAIVSVVLVIFMLRT